MLSQSFANTIGFRWVESWNENNLNDYQLLYDENAEEISTLANRLIVDSNGSIKGKNTLIMYWELLRSKFKNHQFIYQDSNLYKNQVVVHFTIKALNTNAIAKLSINSKNKIERAVICHI